MKQRVRDYIKVLRVIGYASTTDSESEEGADVEGTGEDGVRQKHKTKEKHSTQGKN